MHPRVLLHQSRHLRLPLETRTKASLSFSSSSPISSPRSNPGSVADGVRTQHLSSAASNPSPEDAPSSDVEVKPRRRTLRSYAKPADKSADANGALSTTLFQNDIHDILWLPSGRPGSSGEAPEDPEHDPDIVGLPEPWLLQEAYESLLLTLHPQTQHRAAYVANNGHGRLIEPTLALYCPIEGGDYVVDATVRNIAKRVDADVVVIDAIDLTAGEHGAFGKAASVLHFPQNPLQHSVIPQKTSAQTGRSLSNQDEDDEDDSLPFFANPSSSFTIQIPVVSQTGGPPGYRPSRSGSSPLSPLPRSTSPHSHQRAKNFFEDLLNLTTEITPSEKEEQIRRPRIAYIRDFPLIADQASVWYPPLLAAVRSRRQGPISRPTSPVSQPTVIVFGMTPPLSDRQTDTPSSSSNILSMLTGNRSPSTKLSRPESWAEGDWKARERRLKERLRKWQKGHDWLVDELPKFNGIGPNLSARGSSSPGPDVGFMLGRNIVALPFGGRSGHDGPGNGSSEEGTDGYFRVVGLVPGIRNKLMETRGRFGRRLQYNELAFKMAVAEAGGVLTGRCIEDVDNGLPQTLSRVALAWTQAFEPWRDLKMVADAVVGSVLAENGVKPSGSSLEPTVITWTQVEQTTSGSAAVQDRKKAWVENAAPSNSIKDDGPVATEVEGKVPEIDEVLESVRKDPDLDQHEQRLLGCIVDPATMPTTFKSIHLPPATIDSVRTMVSLPLLYPDAFSTGILKTHSMTGALLFGPPGTGKTLLARAIARESGARMMIIKPSDVMDMYVGEGEKLVRSVFTLARRLSPCVVFLDEIDALFGARVSARESGGAMAHRGVITEFMQEMDGLKSSRDQSVIVIGATNRPFDLDDAVLRRLPRRLLVDLPGPREREEILKILLRDETLAPDVDLKVLAMRTEAFSGSDLKHLCIAAALDAVKETVDVPWAVPSKASSISTDTTEKPTSSEAQVSNNAEGPSNSSEPGQQAPGQEKSVPHVQRTLDSRHFTKALHEITPSASETLGTLLSIRKWNEEFGEGSKGKRRRAWGDKFGFSNIGQGAGLDEGRVMNDRPTASVASP